MKKITIIASVALMVMTACGKKEKAFDATGTFEATEVTISAKATGELKSFDVTEGQVIEGGTQVGRIDTYQRQQTPAVVQPVGSQQPAAGLEQATLVYPAADC